MTQPHDRERKCIISGIGRSGTTFLVELLTELGLDTGFSDPESMSAHYSSTAHAGLDRSILTDRVTPYVVKDTTLCDHLDAVVASRRISIDVIIIPIRKLEDAALSRVKLRYSDSGGLLKTSLASQQKDILAVMLYRLIEAIIRHDIPFVMLHFPRFAIDPRYAYSQLADYLPGIDFDRFCTAFSRISHPELIHKFKNSDVDSTLRKKSFSNETIEKFLFMMYWKVIRRIKRRILRY